MGRGTVPPATSNAAVAQRLREAADLLEQQGALPFRVNAYRRAANTVAALRRDLRRFDGGLGRQALEELPGIGRGIAAAIRELLATGRWSQLERLRGALEPEALLRTVPGVGPELAHRIHEQLGIGTLEALEAAAHDGRLARLPGIGSRRLAALRANLATMLGRWRLRLPPPPARARPTVAELLAVDADYRAQARAGTLRPIAPWLPILHAQHGAWHYSALYSNTARAHELGRTRDWVVIYYYDQQHVEAQCTVVTETSGALKGKRVVRGREIECAAHYGGS
jgi:DNA polymerase (family 10)